MLGDLLGHVVGHMRLRNVATVDQMHDGCWDRNTLNFYGLPRCATDCRTDSPNCKSFIPGSNPGGASRKNEGLQTSSRDLLPVVANSQGDWFRDLIMDDVIALTRLATRLPTLYH